MVAVGLWGAQLGGSAMWLLPVVFPMVMSVGGFLGLIGVPLPGQEIGIALSALLLGAMVCFRVKPKNLIWPALLVGVFGFYHGHAHGVELPPGESGLLYSIGFVIATGTLHLCGITFGLIHRWAAGSVAIRIAGAAIMLGGAYFLWAAVTSGFERVHASEGESIGARAGKVLAKCLNAMTHGQSWRRHA